jgi:hypothetical protein
MEEFVTTDSFRRHMIGVARSVSQSGRAVAIGTTIGRPRYLLRRPTDADDPVRVRLGPDEIRRNFTEIRALIRLEDVRFGILADGELLAVLVRHPQYRPAAVDHYRELFGGPRNRNSLETLERRISLVEIAITAIADRLGALGAKRSSSADDQLASQ